MYVCACFHVSLRTWRTAVCVTGARLLVRAKRMLVCHPVLFVVNFYHRCSCFIVILCLGAATGPIKCAIFTDLSFNKRTNQRDA